MAANYLKKKLKLFTQKGTLLNSHILIFSLKFEIVNCLTLTILSSFNTLKMATAFFACLNSYHSGIPSSYQKIR